MHVGKYTTPSARPSTNSEQEAKARANIGGALKSAGPIKRTPQISARGNVGVGPLGFPDSGRSGRDLLLLGRYSEAVDRLVEHEASLSNDSLTLLGIAERMLHTNRKSYKHLSMAIEKDAKNWRAFSHRSALLLQVYEHERALSDANNALALNPDCFLAKICKSIAEKSYTQSVHILGEIIALNPESEAAWTILAYLVWRYGHEESAFLMAKRILGINPESYAGRHIAALLAQGSDRSRYPTPFPPKDEYSIGPEGVLCMNLKVLDPDI